MKTTNVILVVGATVLVGGGAYLFLKNKKKKDLLKLAELGGTTSGGTTSSGTTSGGATTGGTTSGGTKPPLSTISDGVSPSDANINLANAILLVPKRKNLYEKSNNPFSSPKYKAQLVEIDSQLAKLGYKVDATGTLVKI
jgi:LPXTG-motif cell wall-anchored protein